MTESSKPTGRRINWPNLTTVVSAGILIGAEVFGAAFACGWALAILFDLGQYGVYLLQAIFFGFGIVTMIAFMRGAMVVEPFTDER